MEALLGPVDLVRCVTCSLVYEQRAPGLDRQTSGCPHCGDLAWLGVQVPVEKTAAAPSP